MPTNRYNGRAADTESVPADTILYRIVRADATWDANSFNAHPKPLGDKTQGRFEPIDATLGGYIYLADDIAGAVAEGVLRNQRIPSSGLLQRNWLANKKLATLRLLDAVTVASVYGTGAAKLNLDASFLVCGHRGYSRTREAGTQILLKTPTAQGIRYPCRNHDRLTSLMLVDRGGVAPRLQIEDERDIFTDPSGRADVLGTLARVWDLRYAGALP
jgi:hypothetical protein